MQRRIRLIEDGRKALEYVRYAGRDLERDGHVGDGGPASEPESIAQQDLVTRGTDVAADPMT